MNRLYKSFQGYSLFLVVVVIAFVINWLMFIPAYIFQTEHYFDLTGCLTYLSVLAFAALTTDIASNPRAILLVILPMIWAVRLGSFLFSRISRDGKDTRFDAIKPVFSRFLTTWTLQALWVILTTSAAIAVITST